MEQTIQTDTNELQQIQFNTESVEQVFNGVGDFGRAATVYLNRRYFSHYVQPTISLPQISSSDYLNFIDLNSTEYLVNMFSEEANLHKTHNYQETCSICLDSLDLIIDNSETKSNKPRQLGCSHCFHSHCIGDWLKKKRTCPICRKPCKKFNSTVGDGETKSDEETKSNRDYYYEEDIALEPILTQNLDIIVYDYASLFGPEFINDVTQPQRQLDNSVPDNSDLSDYVTPDGVTIPYGDISIIMNQANCTREQAIRAMITHDFDIVNAIMDLTMG